jgi:hypothetical protein
VCARLTVSRLQVQGVCTRIVFNRIFVYICISPERASDSELCPNTHQKLDVHAFGWLHARQATSPAMLIEMIHFDTYMRFAHTGTYKCVCTCTYRERTLARGAPCGRIYIYDIFERTCRDTPCDTATRNRNLQTIQLVFRLYSSS